MLNIYLAGPFFNEEQLALIEKIRNFLQENGFCVFSPFHDTGGPKKPINLWTEDELEKVFTENVCHIGSSDLVVSVTEYRGVILHVENWAGDCDAGEKKSITLPDVGTVFEIGYAYSKDIPVINYNEKEQAGWNLMLQQCFIADCRNLKQLGITLLAVLFSFGDGTLKAAEQMLEQIKQEPLDERGIADGK